MAQQVLDALNVRAAGNGNGGRCVPEVVGPRVWAANTGRNGLETLVEGVDGIVAPGFICEHQIVRVAPDGPSFQPVLHLLHPLGPEVFEGDGRRLNGAGLAAFGTGCDIVCAAFNLLLQYNLVGTLGSQPGVSSVSCQSYNKGSNWLA